MEKPATDFLGDEVVEALHQAIEQASGLPATVYTDSSFFELEKRHLFPKTWTGVGFDTDIPEPGDVSPIEFCGLPVILVRDQERNVRAFHNICRHRGTVVVTGKQTGLSNLACPYHGWCYALDGKLIATPFWDGTANAKTHAVDPSSRSLVPIRCDVWNHIVFLNLDGHAANLRDYLAPADTGLQALALDDTVVCHRETWSFEANWKLALDNWEVYHHVWVHEGVFDRMSDEIDIRTNRPFTQMLSDDNVMTLLATDDWPGQDVPPPAPLFPKLPPRQAELGHPNTGHAILPNTTLSVSPYGYEPILYVPVAPGVTRTEMAWYFSAEAADERHAAGRAAVIHRRLGPERKKESSEGIRPQDYTCFELQQRARSSPVSNDVIFSPLWETCVKHFQQWLVDTMDS